MDDRDRELVEQLEEVANDSGRPFLLAAAADRIRELLAERETNPVGTLAPAEQGPSAPDYLPPLAATKWTELALGLSRLNMLTPALLQKLEVYAEVYAHYREAQDLVAQTRIVLARQGPDGKTRLEHNPATLELHKFRTQLLELHDEMGLDVLMSGAELSGDEPPD